MTQPFSKTYPQSEMQRWFDQLMLDGVPETMMPRPLSHPITKIWESTLDLGVCGEVPVNVMYEQTGKDVQIKTVSWRGIDIKTYLSELLLMDLQSDIRESLE